MVELAIGAWGQIPRVNREHMVFDRLDMAKCVVLVGPRQVGKSTLARSVLSGTEGAVFIDLQDEEDLARIDDVPTFLRRHDRCLLILDEAQTLPALFPALRVEIDRRRRELPLEHGQVLLLGSASEQLLGLCRVLTGRFSKIDLSGFHILELFESQHSTAPDTSTALDFDNTKGQEAIAPIVEVDTDRLWNRGGMPESYLASTDQESFQWRKDYLENYIDRELEVLGYDFDDRTFKKVLEMVSSRSGNLWDTHDCAKSLRVSANKVDSCLSALEHLGFARELRPWFRNIDKRLTKASKFYVRDTGLLHAVLNFESLKSLRAAGREGASWEGLAIESIIQSTDRARDFFYYRDSNKAEIDLVIEFGDDLSWGIEIRLEADPKPKRGNVTACESMSVNRRIIVKPNGPKVSASSAFEVMSLTDACIEIAGFQP